MAMSVARYHIEWLQLVEVSGPFLSLPVLLRVFPQGLPTTDTTAVRRLRDAYDEWRESQAGGRPDNAMYQAWIRFVLTETLGIGPDARVEWGDLPVEQFAYPVPEQHLTLHPDLAVWRRGRDEPARLLVCTYPLGQNLDAPVAGEGWKASPATRMADLLRGVGVPLGLVTNGEQWMLVHSLPKTPTGFTTWEAEHWLDERTTLDAFRALLGMERFFATADANTLPALYKESADNQQEVTDRLGAQVREAVAMLVRTLDRLDRDRGRALLADVPPETLYEASLAVMMRVVFLLFAEENNLLPRDNTVYAGNYAVSTLGAQLRAAASASSEDVLEQRTDAWSRLLALFRVVHGGSAHSAMRVIAYGGDIFDPDRYPFLEGRAPGTAWRDTPAHPLPVDNRTVLHLLEALQFLTVPLPGGGAERRRLSFRALDIEQIGHVYEGLLDHTARRATGPVLSLRGARERGVEREADVPLARLEAERAKDANGNALLAFLKEATGRSATALKKEITAQPDAWVRDGLRAALDNDDALYDRAYPFLNLVRHDDRDRPLAVAPGSVYVTSGTDRRATGTHYTPRTLTEPIVRHTLDPLVFDGPARGLPPEQWQLRPAAEILALAVCDMAMGSGAFLVQACRYLSERLVEAWDAAERDAGGHNLIMDGTPATGAPGEQPLPRDPAERLAYARRIVADRCLYGVDINTLAVEMAKLSLWLITAQRDRPFTFLDHNLRHGDSLLGIAQTDQLALWSLNREEATQARLAFYPAITRAIADATTARRLIEETPTRDIRDYSAKSELLNEALTATNLVRLGADLLIGAALHPVKTWRADTSTELLHRYMVMMDAMTDVQAGKYTVAGTMPVYEEAIALRAEADRLLAGKRPFHWPLEFPEVFTEKLDGTPPGFAAIVGNPPFMGGKKITGALGTPYREYLVEMLAGGVRGHADLCAYFFLRAMANVRANGGSAGLLATNTIAQGDTREIGLEQLLLAGVTVTGAVSSEPWPGEAALEVAHIWLRRGVWEGPYYLDEREVLGITAYLSEPGETWGNALRLDANTERSFNGSYVMGTGFLLDQIEARNLTAKGKNYNVIFRYLSGEDVSSRPDQSSSRWVINFQDWPLNQAELYPECLKIVRERVKPGRDIQNDKSAQQHWWRFFRPRPELNLAIKNLDQTLVITIHTKHVAFSFVSTKQVYSHALAIIVSDQFRDFTVLSTSLHSLWAHEYASTIGKNIRYTPSDCFETFPFPLYDNEFSDIGRQYYMHRQSIMQARQEGLTKTYNRFHAPHETAADIVQLRALHVEMDEAVKAAYGWHDLDLGHGFHETKQGTRYTVSEAARRALLDRLLRLNHERYAAEVALGLHNAGGSRGKGKGGGGKRGPKVAASRAGGQGALAGLDA